MSGVPNNSLASHPKQPGASRFGALPPLPLVHPKDAAKILSARPAPENLYVPQETVSLLAEVPAGTPSISEQARALGNSVDRIYEFVHDNIEFTPQWGLHKGGLGALIDGSGNAYDMSDLMVQLLKQAGHNTAKFVRGVIRLSAAQWSNWLGVSDQNIVGAAQLLANGGLPVAYNPQTNELFVEHCWVQVDIGGNSFMFDPAFKTYTYTTGVDVQAAMQYVRSAFLTRANQNSTLTADYVQNINESNINADLQTFSMNLSNWIRQNMPGASLDQILGGRKIVPFPGTLRQTDLPYHDTSFQTFIESALPNGLKATMRFQYDETGTPGVYNIDVTFNSADIYSKRLTLWFNGSRVATLRLDGTAVGNTSSQMPSGQTINAKVTVSHPYALPPEALTHLVPVLTGAQGTICSSWGITSMQMAGIHQEAQNQAIADGAASGDEDLLGQSLLLIWDNFMGQGSRGVDILGRLTQMSTTIHHFVGSVSQRTFGSGKVKVLDSFLGAFSTSALETGVMPNSPPIKATAVSTSLLFQVLESAAHQQVMGIECMDAIKALKKVNALGQQIYDAKSANWATVRPLMAAAPYPTDVLNAIETQFINTGGRAAMPINAAIPSGAFNFYAYIGIGANGTSVFGQTWFNAKGAVSDNYQDDAQTNSASSDNARQVNGFGMPAVTAYESARVNLLNGRYEYSSQDLTVGNQGAPHELAFVRSYNSALRLSLSKIGSSDNGLGFGWTHNWQMKASANSDGFVGFGDQQVRDAAAVIASLFVTRDVALSDPTLPINNVVINCIVQVYLASQLVNNVARLQFGGSFLVFTKLPNGSFLPPLGLNGASQLVKDTGTGKFIYTTPEKVVHTYKTTGEIETIVYPYGITITFTYTSGRLTKVSNGFRDLNFTYDTFDQLRTVHDGNSRVVTFTLSSSTGNMTVVEDPEGKVTTYEYDQRGRITKIFKPANPTSPIFTNIYDSLSRVKEQKDAYNNLWQFFLAGSRSEEVAPNGTSRILYFNAKGSILRAINALGQEVVSQFDGQERATLVSQPEGNSSETTYDANGNVLSVTQHAKPGSGLADRATTFTYDTTWTSKVKTSTDPAGKVTTTTYVAEGQNGAGKVAEIQQPAVSLGSPITKFTYNSKGQLLTSEDPTGRKTSNSYEAVKNNLVSTTADPGPGGLNIISELTYDTVGNVLTTKDPKGNVTAGVYDKNRRVTQVTGPAPFNPVSSIIYDDNGNVIERRDLATSDADEQITKAAYTVDGKAASVTGPINYGQGSQAVPLRYEYDELRRLSKAIDSAGRVSIVVYDAVSRPVSSIVDGATQLTISYTSNGQVLSVRDGRNNTTGYEYDGFDRPKRVNYPNSAFEEVSYDVRNNVLQTRTRAGTLFDFTYDALNRLLTKTAQGEPTVTLSYDLAGRPLTVATPQVLGDPSTGTFSFVYDGAGRMVQEQRPDGLLVTAVLDNNGNVERLRHPDLSEVTQTFDTLDRLISVSGFSGSVTLGYDSASRRRSQMNGNKTGQGYFYDKADNLLALTIGGLKPNLSIPTSPQVEFAYGFNDATQDVSKLCNDGGFLWQPSLMKTITYGSANNLNQYPTVDSTTFSYDSNGCLTGDGVNTYGYNHESRLVSVIGPGSSASFKYDPLDRLAEKTVGGTKVRYLYFGMQRIEEYNETGGLLRRYVYGSGLDECLFIVDSGGTITYLHADESGSTILTTDITGTAIQRNVYTPWGELVSGSLSNMRVGFTGQFYEPEVDLYYFKARFYSPKLGRFLQPDPIRYDGGMNLYEYAGSDPVNLGDPLGLFPRQSGFIEATGFNDLVTGRHVEAITVANQANITSFFNPALVTITNPFGFDLAAYIRASLTPPPPTFIRLAPVPVRLPPPPPKYLSRDVANRLANQLYEEHLAAITEITDRYNVQQVVPIAMIVPLPKKLIGGKLGDTSGFTIAGAVQARGTTLVLNKKLGLSQDARFGKIFGGEGIPAPTYAVAGARAQSVSTLAQRVTFPLAVWMFWWNEIDRAIELRAESKSFRSSVAQLNKRIR